MAEQPNPIKTPKFKGKILLCDDNEISRHIVASYLSSFGFEVTLADNGRECVDIVADSQKNAEAPFDLIFMDIYMPVMGGTEAADALAGIGCKTPVVALTANTTPNDKELYAAHGMPVSLNKSTVMDELLPCLSKYFTPLGFEAASGEPRANDEAKRRNRLLTGFVKRNQTTFSDLSGALETGDINLAHRLAHTLKGIAGLMGETALQEASRAVEHSLSDGGAEYIKEQMDTLGEELAAVLGKLSPLLNEQKARTPHQNIFDKAKAVKVLERLEPLLRADSAGCLDLLDELRQFPEAAALTAQIEDYEFETALETLLCLKKTFEV